MLCDFNSVNEFRLSISEPVRAPGQKGNGITGITFFITLNRRLTPNLAEILLFLSGNIHHIKRCIGLAINRTCSVNIQEHLI